jgi:hypothetical protein
LGPMGPVLHCGVLSVSQCRHLLPSPAAAAVAAGGASFFLEDLAGFFARNVGEAPVPDSDGEMAADPGGDGSTRRREDQLHGATRERLLRALAGGGTPPQGCAGAGAGAGADALAAGGTPVMNRSFRRSSVGKLSSPMQLDSHSSSAR